MGSPMPKISWGCKKPAMPIESDCESDETYYNETSPGIKVAKATVASIATSSNILHQGFHSLKLTTKTNVECTSSIDSQLINKEWSDSSSSRQETPASNSRSSRHLSWKDPIASSCQIRSKRYPKQSVPKPFPRKDNIDIKLDKLQSWLFKTDLRLTSSLLSGGQPLTCDEAERMLRKAKQCLQLLEKLHRGPEELLSDAKCLAEKIVKRVVKKIQETREISDQQCKKVTQSMDRFSLGKSSQMTDDFVPKSPILQTNFLDSQELTKTRYNGDNKSLKQVTKRRKQTPSQSQTQMTTKGFTLSQNRFEKRTNNGRKQLRWDCEAGWSLPPIKIKGLEKRHTKKSRLIPLGSESDSQVKFSETSLQSRDNVRLQELRESSGSPSLLESQGTTQVQNCVAHRPEVINIMETQDSLCTLSEPLNHLTTDKEVLNSTKTQSEILSPFRMETETQNPLGTLLLEGSSDMFLNSNSQSETQISESTNSIVAKCGETDKKFATSEQNCEILTSQEVGNEVDCGDFEAAKKSSDNMKGTGDIIDETMESSDVTDVMTETDKEFEGIQANEGRYSTGDGTRTNGTLPGGLTSAASVSQTEDFSQDIIGDSQPTKFESFGKLGRKVKHLLQKRTKASLEKADGKEISLPFCNEAEDFTKEPALQRSASLGAIIFKNNLTASKVSTLSFKVQSGEKAIECEESRDVLGSLTTAKAKQNNLQNNADFTKTSPAVQRDCVALSLPERVTLWREKENADASSELLSKSRSLVSIDEIVLPKSIQKLPMETKESRKMPEIVIPVAETLDDERWRLLEKYYETQKKLRENAICTKTDSLPATQTQENVRGIDVSHISSGGKESSLQNLSEEENSGPLSLTPEISFPVTQISSETVEWPVTNLTRIDRDELSESSGLFQESMEICGTRNDAAEIPSEGDLTANAKCGRTLTQLLLEDSQEVMDTQPATELVRQTVIKLTDETNREQVLSQEISVESQENITQLLSSSVKPMTNSMMSNVDDGSLTQSMLEDSQENSSNLVEKSLETDSTASVKGGQSFTQLLLEDSQEMTDTQLGTKFVRSPTIKLTYETNDEREFSQKVIENSQEILPSPEKIKIPSIKSKGAIPKVFQSRLVTNSPNSGERKQNSVFGASPVFVSSKSVVLGASLLEGKSPKAAEKFTFQSREWGKSELRQQEFNDFAPNNFGNVTLRAQKDSMQAFGADAKLQSLKKPIVRNENDAETKSSSSLSKANYRDLQNMSEAIEHEFIQPQIPEKKGIKRPLQNSSGQSQKSPAEISMPTKPNLTYHSANRNPLESQPFLRDAKKWPPTDFDHRKENVSVTQQPMIVADRSKNVQNEDVLSLQLHKVATKTDSSNAQTKNRPENPFSKSSANSVGNKRFLCYQLPTNQQNLQTVPGVTAIGVELRRVQPNKSPLPHNLEMGKRMEMQNSSESQNCPKRYEYFVGTPMDENAARKLKCYRNSTGAREVFEGKACGSFNSQNQELLAIGCGNNMGSMIPGNVMEFNKQNMILYQDPSLKCKIIHDKSKDLPPRQPSQDQIQAGQRFSLPASCLQAKFESLITAENVESAKTPLMTKNQDIPTSQQEQYETFDSLILKMFDYKNVLKRRENEGQNFVVAKSQSNLSQLEQATDILSPCEAQKSPSFLSKLLFPTNLEPARAAERKMILSLTHVRTRTPRDFAPRNEKIAEFFQKPFTWENIPKELLRDLEESSDEDIF